MQYLKENEIKTKTDKYFSKSQLYHLLTNKVYIGKITHKDKVYDGEHEAIICDEFFEKVQEIHDVVIYKLKNLYNINLPFHNHFLK